MEHHSISRRRLLRLTAGGLILGAAAGQPSVILAQDAPIPATGAGYYRGLDQMTGLVSVIARAYQHTDALPQMLNPATPGTEAQLSVLDLTIASFDSPENAVAALPAFGEIAQEHLGTRFDDMHAIDPSRLDGLASETIAYEFHLAEYGYDFGKNMWIGAMIAPFGVSLVYARITGFGEPPIDAPIAEAIAVVQQTGEASPGTGDPVWAYDGTSIGGDWDRLPDGGDPILGDLAGNLIGGGIPVDTALFPEFLF